MADNFAFTEGSGKTGAADDVGGVLYARVKIDLGTDGVGTPAVAGAGAVSTGVQRVTLASDDPAVVSLAIIDDWDDGDKCKVIIQTGSNAIGKLAANTGVDIGDVDVTSVIAGVGATNLGKARDSALGGTDTGVMALVVRDDTLTTLTPADGDFVPLRVNSTGALHVTGGGGTQYAINDALGATPTGTLALVIRDDALGGLTPVEGDAVSLYVDANGALWTHDNALKAVLDGNYLNVNMNIAGTDVAGGSGGQNAQTQRVILATDDPAVAHLNNVVTAVQLIDDTVYVDDADWTDNTSKHLLVGGVYQSSPHTVTDGDVSPFGVDINGNIVLGTSAKAIGKLAANTGIDIGDVDVTSIVPGVGATNLGKAEDAGHSSGDVGVAAMTVRANTATSLSGSDNDYQPLITDTNGRLHVLDANTANMLTALQIIDDWDATHDSAASADGPQLMAAYDATKPAAVADGDAVRVLADEYGRLLSGVEKTAWHDTLDSADASAAGVAVKASAASTILVIQSYIISVDAEMWVHLVDEDDTVLTGKFWLKAGGGVAITLPDKAPILMGVDKDLEVRTEGAGNISVSATGYTIPG